MMVYDEKSNELSWGYQEIQRANLLLAISIGIKETLNPVITGHENEN
jgi:hypothetical protein